MNGFPDSAYRTLSKKEAEEYREWARKNHKPGDKINPVWHPVIRTECKRIDREAAQ